MRIERCISRMIPLIPHEYRKNEAAPKLGQLRCVKTVINRNEGLFPAGLFFSGLCIKPCCMKPGCIILLSNEEQKRCLCRRE